jgi:hypothetical protein
LAQRDRLTRSGDYHPFTPFDLLEHARQLGLGLVDVDLLHPPTLAKVGQDGKL